MTKATKRGRRGNKAALWSATALVTLATAGVGHAQTAPRNSQNQPFRPSGIVQQPLRTYTINQASLYPGQPGQTPGRVTVAGQPRTSMPGLYPGAVPVQTGMYPGTNSPYPPGYNPPSPATVIGSPNGCLYYGGNNTTVIINNNGYNGAGYYDNGYNGSGYYNGSTTVIAGNGTSLTIFNGYRTAFVSGQTVASPFALYGCPAYIGSRWAVAAPYAYAEGRETPQTALDDTRASRASLRTALDDLTRYWENEDVRGLRRRLSPDLNVAVFQAERYSYALKRTDFLALSTDALDRVETVGFRFDDVRDRNDGLVNAYATHTYKIRGSSRTATATVRCTLVFVDNDWFLSAVSFSPGSLNTSAR